MIDTPSTTAFETRLPAAYSQGFAHVRILTTINPDDTGPLGGLDLLDVVLAPDSLVNSAPKPPLDDLLRAD